MSDRLPTAASRAQRFLAWVDQHRSRLLLAIGAAWGVYFAFHYAKHAADPFTGLPPRLNSIEQVIAAMKAGAPPIFALDPGPENPGFYKPDLDARGMVFFYPLAGRILGVDDAQELLRISFIACMAAAAAVLPWLYGTLFRSVIAGAVAPLILMRAVGVNVLAITPVDMYWIPGLLIVTGAPLLMLALTRWDWDRRTVLALTGMLVVASLGNSIRPQVGLPLLIGALAVVLVRAPTWRSRGLVAACLLVAYVSISGVAMTAASTYRDWRVDDSAKFSVRSYEEPGGAGDSAVWHQLYIGLAFVRNDQGVDQYLDEEAIAYVERTAPGTRYLSQRYANVLRDRVVEIVKDDPAFIAETLGAKFAAVASLTFERWRLFVLAVPLLLLFGPLRHEARRWVLLLALIMLIGLIPPLISWPSDAYSVPYASTFVVVGMLAVAWLGKTIAQGLAWLVADMAENDWAASGGKTGSDKAVERIRAGIDGPALARTGGLAVCVVLAALGGGALLTSVARGARDTTFYSAWSGYEVRKLPPVSSIAGEWRMQSGLPSGWFTDGAASTTRTRRGVQIGLQAQGVVASVPVASVTGRYIAVVRARISRGGAVVRVIDEASRRSLADGYFWTGHTPAGAADLIVPVDMVAPTQLRIAITNWSRRNEPSVLSVESAKLYRAKSVAP